MTKKIKGGYLGNLNIIVGGTCSFDRNRGLRLYTGYTTKPIISYQIFDRYQVSVTQSRSVYVTLKAINHRGVMNHNRVNIHILLRERPRYNIMTKHLEFSTRISSSIIAYKSIEMGRYQVSITRMGAVYISQTPQHYNPSSGRSISPSSSFINPYISPSLPYFDPLSQLSPFITPINNSQPQVINNSSDSMDNDIGVREEIYDYFKNKTFKKWIKSEDENNIIKFFKVKDDKVIKLDNDKRKNNKLNKDDIEKIIKHIRKNIYTKSDLKETLKKSKIKYGCKYYELKEKKSLVKELILKAIRKRIKYLDD
tara:strand:- start:3439 stop:4368 length:930 start_codon:yes stop_codon:yes gene_type:complete